MTPNTRRWLAGTAFLLAGSTGMAVAFTHALHQAGTVALPGPIPLAMAVVLSGAGIGLEGLGWAHAVDASKMPASAVRGFAVSQLGKYIPGGVWGPAGQIGFTKGGHLSTMQIAARFVGFAATMVAAASIVATTSAVASDLNGTWTIIALASTASLLVLVPGAGTPLRNTLTRAFRREVDTVLPDRVMPVLAWSVAGRSVHCLGFALVLGAVHADTATSAAVAAFALAWMVGFVAAPIPAGIGVREAVLVAVLGSATPTATIIAASVAHRLACIVGEAGLVVVLAVLRSRSPEHLPSDPMRS